MDDVGLTLWADCTARAVSWATNAPSATPAPTPRSSRSRASQQRRTPSSTSESVSPTSTRQSARSRAQRSASSGGVCLSLCCRIPSLSPSRVTRPHGSSGVVKSKFTSNLPPRAFGASVRVVRPSFAPAVLRSHSVDALPVHHLSLAPFSYHHCNMNMPHMHCTLPCSGLAK